MGPPASNRKDRNNGCCASFTSELNPCQSWYLVRDSRGTIDIPASFAPGSVLAILLKFITTTTAIGTLAVGLLFTETPDFFFAYFTNLSLAVTVIYQICSFRNTLLSSRIQQPSDKASGIIKWTWLLFILGVHAQIMASALWWFAVYPTLDTLEPASIFPHGIVAGLSILDGLAINRIPIRMMHWWGWVLVPEILYLVWTIVHAYLDIGNPNEMDNDAATNDDAIYLVLVWDDESLLMSAILSAVVVLVLGPLVYLILWFCSNCSRRYLVTEDAAEGGSVYQKF